MKKSFTRKFAVLLAAVMLFCSFTFTAAQAAGNASSTAASSEAAQSGDLPSAIADGAILHAWCWSFNTIKENIPQIAEAGFKSVQTSPINAIKRGENGGMCLKSENKGNWWYQYQPTDYTIGNYMLGTEEEFMAMCEEAHKYGVKVIVDIVANHCSSDYSVISSHVKSITQKAFHDRVEISDWSNRYQVTQGKLTGLYDLNTQDAKVQKMIADYMKDVLSKGADGFRFDAAKHIELPDDDPSYAGNFWPTVLDNSAEYQYGEILTGADRIGAYSRLMHVTAESYGSNLQKALAKKTISASTVKNYKAYDENLNEISADRLVTWVESHDNYCGDAATWRLLDNKQIQQGWAIIAAQGDTTPLFFARPDGSSTTDQWGKNTIGIAGDGNYFSNEVTAVNHFRNAMVGKDKNIVTVIKQKVTMIERGNSGAVIVSVSDNDNTVNTETALPDGEYTDRANGGKFTVKNGVLTGEIKAGAVAVLYNDSAEPEYMTGDLNRNGQIDIQDATILQRHLAEFTNPDGTPIVDERDPVDFKIADFDGDGHISVNDVTGIQKVLAQ